MLRINVSTKVLEKERVKSSSFYKVDAYGHCLQDLAKFIREVLLTPMQNNGSFNEPPLHLELLP